MKTNLKQEHAGRTIAPALAMFAALAAFVLFTAPAPVRAQGAAPDAPSFAGPESDEFEIAIDGPDNGEFEEFNGGPLAMHGMGGIGGGAGMHGGMHGGMRGRHAEMMETLNLTDKQRNQMADLRDAQARKMIGIRGGLAEAQLDMKKLMRADAPSQAQIDATIDRMAKLRADAAKSRVATHLAMRGLLTTAQRKTMDEMRHGGMGGAHKGGSPEAHGGGKHGV